MLVTVRDHRTLNTITYTYIIHYHTQSYHATIFYNNKKNKTKKGIKKWVQNNRMSSQSIFAKCQNRPLKKT